MAAAGWNALFLLINGRRLYQSLQKDRQIKAEPKHGKIAAPFEDAPRRTRAPRPSEESFCTNQTDESFVSEATEA